ncbi:MAG TPA: SDR family oxidoreductase [Solirubrobacterales bacterium]
MDPGGLTPKQGPHSLDGRVALVTGSSSGLGRGSALALGRAGATVLCLGRNAAALGELVEEMAGEGSVAEPFPGDLTDDDVVVAAVARATELGPLEVVVNAAGLTTPGPATTYRLEDLDAQFAINVRAMFSVSRAAAAAMTAGERGSIVNFSSILGTGALPGDCGYVATKHAVEGLTKALAVEWAASGIRVNAVAPGFVETPFSAHFLADPANLEFVEGRTPLGRLIEVAEVARAVAYLATEASAGVTGHILRIDGGWTVW